MIAAFGKANVALPLIERLRTTPADSLDIRQLQRRSAPRPDAAFGVEVPSALRRLCTAAYLELAGGRIERHLRQRRHALIEDQKFLKLDVFHHARNRSE